MGGLGNGYPNWRMGDDKTAGSIANQRAIDGQDERAGNAGISPGFGWRWLADQPSQPDLNDQENNHPEDIRGGRE